MGQDGNLPPLENGVESQLFWSAVPKPYRARRDEHRQKSLWVALKIVRTFISMGRIAPIRHLRAMVSSEPGVFTLRPVKNWGTIIRVLRVEQEKQEVYGNL